MTVVRGRWFPVSVVLPGQRDRPWQRCYAVATDTALHLFRRPSEVADWSAPIVWDRTTLPGTDLVARRGFDVHTEAGLVVVTLSSGCRCGSLGRWAGPTWARTETIRA